ncbi:MAG: 1-deoxy-D-xylulose-5-phosphate reductoisomerase [Elusimicrobia bacterium RIFOXYD2_FULL_34_15]|nr:MAG: 1-deoxy-D-xylulose-5-phosphate reductoisomerase [Elusimicrobia bacterium RIFOXYD2_FULL_34_15]
MKISVLGSTGSIGTSALDVISNLKNYTVVGLSANNNKTLLNKQINKFKPKYVAVGSSELKDISLIKEADLVLIAVVGFAGLIPLINAIKLKKRIALANKEALVIAGDLINKLIRKYPAEIIPVDSEHSAIFQCINGNNPEEISKIILTASGGPFRNYPYKKLSKVCVNDVLKHPTWKMGKKITVDSATMINKGFEVIEAHYLFGVPYDKIEVVIHPQSIVHSGVEFTDGSIIAQLGRTDMRLPIQYALTYPERVQSTVKKLNLTEVGKLEFFKLSAKNFPCFELAMSAAKISGSMLTVLNAANEVAVMKFLDNKISFIKIPKLIEKAMKKHKVIKNPDLEDIIEVDSETRKYVEEIAR